MYQSTQAFLEASNHQNCSPNRSDCCITIGLISPYLQCAMNLGCYFSNWALEVLCLKDYGLKIRFCASQYTKNIFDRDMKSVMVSLSPFVNVSWASTNCLKFITIFSEFQNSHSFQIIDSHWSKCWGVHFF